MTNDNENPKSPFTVKRIVFLVIAIVLGLLLVRCPAEALTEDAQAIAEHVGSVLSSQRIDSSVDVLGQFGDLQISEDQILSSDQGFFFSSSQFNSVYSIAQFSKLIASQSGVDGQQIEQEMLEIVRSSLADSLNPSSWIIEVTAGGVSSYIVVSESGDTYGGSFAVLSRSYGLTFSPSYGADIRNGVRQKCAYKALTRDFLGRDAEWVEICTKSICEQGKPTTCKSHKLSGAKPFGSVEFNPIETPEDGLMNKNVCLGEAFYTWQLGLPSVRLGGYQLDIPLLRMKRDGSVTSNTICF